jgi:hypothetical protein
MWLPHWQLPMFTLKPAIGFTAQVPFPTQLVTARCKARAMLFTQGQVVNIRCIDQFLRRMMPALSIQSVNPAAGYFPV